MGQLISGLIKVRVDLCFNPRWCDNERNYRVENKVRKMEIDRKKRQGNEELQSSSTRII